MLIKHSTRQVRKGCYCHGSTELFWAHDTTKLTNRDGSQVQYCEDCKVTGAMVLINRSPSTTALKPGDVADEAYRHSEDKPPTAPEDKPTVPGELVTESKAVATAKAAVTELTPAADRAKLLEMLLSPAVDEAAIRRIVADAMKDITQPVRTVIVREREEPRTVPGLTHSALADVITDLLAGSHVLMVGPAGTGKSTIARQASESLDLRFNEISLNPGMSATALLGYMQAEGRYVRTLFRDSYENGGVFHFDEFDNGHPSTLATINAALANGHMAFPDTMVTKHENFLCVASANTYGRGADRQYVGRQAIDAATLDRFTVETIDVDEALEEAVCLSTGYDAHKVRNVLSYTRGIRRNAVDSKMAVIISPRASIGMCRLLSAGKGLSATIDAVVRKGMSDTDWSKIQQGVRDPVI